LTISDGLPASVHPGGSCGEGTGRGGGGGGGGGAGRGGGGDLRGGGLGGGLGTQGAVRWFWRKSSLQPSEFGTAVEQAETKIV